MTENSQHPETKPAPSVPFDKWIQRFYRLGVALLAIFVLISALVFVGRAANAKMRVAIGPSTFQKYYPEESRQW